MIDPAPAAAAADAPIAAATAPPGEPGLLSRLGLAIVRPRWALAIAGDRRHAGRSGSDLIATIGLVVLATQLRGLATAAWLAGSIDLGLGVRAASRVVTGALAVNLGLLVVGALGVFALAGPRRNLGRAFDLACVAALPLWFVELGATVVVRGLELGRGLGPLPGAVSWLLSGLAVGWMGALIALAIRPARGVAVRVPAPPSASRKAARRTGGALAGVLAIGVAIQAVWIADNLELVRPMKHGDPAPGFALPRVERGGALGPLRTLAASRGKVVVLDFWATWCKPCLAALPRLDQLSRAHPDVDVIAINLDDAAAARALFDDHRYAMTLVADDGEVSQRYGVSSIPHTVVIDRGGMIREVARGTAGELAALVDDARAAP